jgi:predicted N-acetyltransferase YhbS
VISAPEPLSPHHNLQPFDCGRPSLNEWLKRKALKAQQIGGSARTYVVCTKEAQVVGYYALATGSINREDAPGRVRRNSPDPIPVVILGRLAVDETHKGQGIGPGLLKDALLRVLGAAEEIGIRAVLVHTLDENARSFYFKHGFYESPTDQLTVMLAIQDIQAALKS